jgi:hypothetical protein
VMPRLRASASASATAAANAGPDPARRFRCYAHRLRSWEATRGAAQAPVLTPMPWARAPAVLRVEGLHGPQPRRQQAQRGRS